VGRARRWPAEIISEILKSAIEGNATMTTLVYGSKSNHARTKKYVDQLVAKGFLDRTGPDSRLYRTTEKGQDAIRVLDQMLDLLLRD
jgi:predicted transcriptional regulator